ncbi:TlpA family protein disulfide reductase [Bdellovibrio bacteriovorus]|uniref:Cytochrome C biogenesis protein n=1 Tax=Bdellovibrio bacteriovorus TaxID=959 RepID=A0A1Z3N7T3_BDEBC|nr:TlpA disulfide reductase family protein [Bdellovibrio bacteriovorus]ASD63542.1 cytochrome C biogenesis protein [Bdellovibrio bacteriovorus]
MRFLPVLLLLCASSVFAKEMPSTVEFKRLPTVALNKSDIKTLKDLQGKVVLVDFWAAWCEPCKAALPHYNSLYKKYRSQGLVVLGVNEDEEVAEREAFLKTVKLEFPLYHDQGRLVLEDFKVLALPTLYVFDKKLKPVVFYRGYDEKNSQALEKKIQELLKQ